ncbi:hypothetical protein cyc_06615 [Cyclospora cayetanensis]|uniref:Transmembrane protein n=1 Tax=Cyclospora cayetanensis TaxID=88456 RepID=A0A1D3D5H4_9EIME|nr:hypothetical protein cyc_06615 [Cyclospora cayetanensis]
MSTMISLYCLPFVFAVLVSAAVEQKSDILPNSELAVSYVKAGSADSTSNQATSVTHLQSFQKDKDGFLGKKKLSLSLAAAIGILLVTLLVLNRSKLRRLLGYVESVHGDGLPEEVSTTG